MYMRELSIPCLVTLQVVKASRSYFSSYRGSPQTKVSGGSKKGAASREPDQIHEYNKNRNNILFQGIDLWITPYKFIRIQTGKDTSRCINYKYPYIELT